MRKDKDVFLGAAIGAILALGAGAAHAWFGRNRQNRSLAATVVLWSIFGAVVGGMVGSRLSATTRYREAMSRFTPVTSTGQFDELVLRSDVPVLVDFHTPGCVYCKKLAPTLGKLADAYKGRVRFVSVDGSRLGELVQRYGVTGYPTVLVFVCLLYTSPSPRDLSTSRMPSSA